MTVYIRVSDDADSPGVLYSSKFRRLYNVEPQPSDLLISATTAFWKTIVGASPTHLVIRVHEDKYNQDPGEGRIFNDSLTELTDVFSQYALMKNGSPVIFTVTPDELQVVLDARA